MICVLTVIEGPAKGTKCWLNSGQRVTIGRLSTSDFSVADQHMSRTHLIVEGSEVAFRIRDAGSSNGTFVNDSKIAILELCSGDRIRAGTTVFEVDIEKEQGGSSTRKPAEVEVPLEALPIPQRTLSTESLDDFDFDETKRYSSARLKEAPTQIDSFVTESASVSESVNVEPSKIESDVTAPFEVVPSTFFSEFPIQVGKSIWRQSANGPQKDPQQIIELLSRVKWDVKLSLVINRSQIDDSECDALDLSVSAGESRPISETLYLLQSKRPQVVLGFFRRCLNKDAAVCIASAKQLQDAWILDVRDALSFPSMLYELVSKSQDRAVKLTQGNYFLLFEPTNQGELCVLRNALPAVSLESP